jgi:hypothetical protein
MHSKVLMVFNFLLGFPFPVGPKALDVIPGLGEESVRPGPQQVPLHSQVIWSKLPHCLSALSAVQDWEV